MPKFCVSPGEDRPHTVYRYTDQIYKVIQFNRVIPRFGPGPRDSQEHHTEKLDSSVSRAKRVILEKALCNSWEWFCTFTIAESKCDRTDLQAWALKFTQWLRDLRKQGKPIQYLLVPERHLDGSWHAHGLFSGLSDNDLISFREMDKQGYRSDNGRRLPKKLRDSDYMNWLDYQDKFGFCSFGKIQNSVACGFYVTKYITKDNDRMVKDVGLHSYYCSKGLNAATKHVDFFGRAAYIDRLLVNKYDFCSTGMTHTRDKCDWTFCCEFVDFADLEPLRFDEYGVEKTPAELEADAYSDFEQMCFSINL